MKLIFPYCEFKKIRDGFKDYLSEKLAIPTAFRLEKTK